jgi:diguanylate cyclase
VGNIKGQDTAARYGGEEFAVILPDTPLVSGAKVAETLRRAIETRELINKSDNKKLGSITISIGVAELRAGEQPATLIERADEALYKAKNAGRNRVSTAD